MTPSEKILQKALIGSKSTVDSRYWTGIQASLRDRAFFSSQVESAKILYSFREKASEYAKGGTDLSKIRMELRDMLRSSDYRPDEKDAGTIKDLYSQARLDTIIKTNVSQARGYITWLETNSPGAFAVNPAQELVRVHQRKQQRDWITRWKSQGGKVFAGNRMIALKDDPIWTRISVFGNPFPPFDWGSGMGVEPVSFDEAEKFGLITRAQLKEKVQEIRKREANGKTPCLNDNLSSPVPFDNKSPEYARLKKAFGDQIQFNREKNAVQWRSDLFADMFEPGHRFTIKLGEASEALTSKLPESIPADAVQGKHLTVNETWLDRKRKDKTTDHRIHFEEMDDHPEDIPLKKGDVDILPSVWRKPDRVFEDNGSLILEVDAIEGGMFRAVVKLSNSPTLKTFYRTTESWEDYLKKRMARHK